MKKKAASEQNFFVFFSLKRTILERNLKNWFITVKNSKKWHENGAIKVFCNFEPTLLEENESEELLIDLEWPYLEFVYFLY